MKNIRELQAIVDSLGEWVITIGYLATCPRPYTPMDKFMIVTADQKIERALKLLKKEVADGVKLAGNYEYQALRFRDSKMREDAIVSYYILNGIIVQTNSYIEKFNTCLALCEAHI